MVDFRDLKERWNSFGWIKYLIITIIIVIVVVIIIFTIKYFKNKKQSKTEQFNLSKNISKESFDIKDLPSTNWVDSKATITDFVKSWKDTIKKAYETATTTVQQTINKNNQQSTAQSTSQLKKASEGFVAPRNNFGNAERKYKLATGENVSKPQEHLYMNNYVKNEQFQQPRTKKDYLGQSFLNGLSVKTGTNYRY